MAPTDWVPSTTYSAPTSAARRPTASRSKRVPSVQCTAVRVTTAVSASMASSRRWFQARPTLCTSRGRSTKRSVAPLRAARSDQA